MTPSMKNGHARQLANLIHKLYEVLFGLTSLAGSKPFSNAALADVAKFTKQHRLTFSLHKALSLAFFQSHVLVNPTLRVLF